MIAPALILWAVATAAALIGLALYEPDVGGE